jgi:phosphoribosylanthranilate isomerase
MTTAVKICGITRVEDALAAVGLGARALGFVFVAASRRCVTPTHAAAIIRRLPPFVTAVALFVDPQPAQVEQVMREAHVDLLQFHGDEPAEFCGQFNVPYVKAARVRPDMDLLQYARRYGDARALLLDAYVTGSHGGTGVAFDWNLIPRDLPLPLILSGGLTAQNVAEAIRRVRPWAVDVSTGVETSPGVKDERKMAAFFQGVRDADA